MQNRPVLRRFDGGASETANGAARGRDEERERRTENTRDRKIDIGTRSVRASEKGGGRREGGGGGGTGRKRRGRDEEGRAKSSSENGIYR